MKEPLLILLVLISLSSCQLNWYGDIDLGSNFYYMIGPAFNSIVIPVHPEKPYSSSIYIVKDVEEIGFNNNLIIAISNDQKAMKYWRINKNEESIKMGYKENAVLTLSNVSLIDSLEFYQIKNSEEIHLKSNTDYRQELNYE